MPRPTLSTDPSRGFPERVPASDGLALPQVWGVLRRSWAWVVGPTLLALVAAGLFVQLVPPRYTGEAKVLLESRDPAFARTVAERTEPNAPIDEQAVASQVQVVMSRDLAREAIRRLKLVGNPEFDPYADGPGPVLRTLMMLGLVQAPMERAPEDRVLDDFLEHLLVYPVGKSRILAIEFRSKDPALAAEGANTVAELYIGSLAAAAVDTARYASTWLGTNISELRAKVTEAEAKVEAFRARSGLVAMGNGSTAGQPLSARQLGELSSQLSQARTISADLGARAKLLKDMIKEGRAFEIPDVANNELIRRTVESRMTLRAQLALESRTLLSAHPRIKELTAQVNDLEAQIKAAAERIVRTTENDARIAAARVESLQGAVAGQRDVVVKGNSDEIELRALEREAKAQREQLESYLARYREATARDAENAAPADARVVSRAVVPELPSFPRKIPILAFAGVLALALSSAGVLGRHLLASPPAGPAVAPPEPVAPAPPHRADPTRTDYPEPMPLSGMPEARQLWAAAPVIRGPEPATASRAIAPSAPGPDEIMALIARIDRPRGGEGACVLVVEGGAGGGAQRLARALAERARVLSVDVTGATAAEGRPGLSDLVAGEAAFPEVIRSVAGSRMHAVGPGRIEIEVLLDEPKGLAIGLNAMAQAYDWVICRLEAEQGELSRALLSTLGACMDTVVLSPDAARGERRLAALRRLAEESGAAQILALGPRPGEPASHGGFSDVALRLSA